MSEFLFSTWSATYCIYVMRKFTYVRLKEFFPVNCDASALKILRKR